MFSRKIGRKKRFSLAMCGALVGSALALGFGAPAAQAAEEKVLNIYNWSDYIGEDTVANFEKETGIKVRYDNFDSNETLHAKLVAGKTGYDVVMPSSNWGKIQIEGGLFAKLDPGKIANLKNLDPWFMQNIATMDPGNQYLVPWLGGFTTIGINVEKLKAALGDLPMPDNAWDLLFKPEYVNKAKSCGVSLLDTGDEVFPAALRYLGKPAYSKNPADYKEAAALLQTIRPAVGLFSSAGYINDLANGSLCMVLGWNGDIAIAAARARENRTGNNIQPLVPKKGAVLFFDTMAIPADAPHVENAYKWINYILRPEVQAGMVNKVKYRGPVRAADALVKPEVSSNKAVFMSPADMAAMVPPEALGNDIRRLRTRLFTTFKTGL
ncbi:extracellular solute-binding protein [Ramlibacter monticola]|nr:extracellular solute-binding protein [Ramlibacter monticola]